MNQNPQNVHKLAGLLGLPQAGAGQQDPLAPQVSPNACATQLGFNVYFADGDNMTLNPPAVGTEGGDPDELCAEIDRVCKEVKDIIRLKFQHRLGLQEKSQG